MNIIKSATVTIPTYNYRCSLCGHRIGPEEPIRTDNKWYCGFVDDVIGYTCTSTTYFKSKEILSHKYNTESDNLYNSFKPAKKMWWHIEICSEIEYYS